jgi:hypothetical protein
VACKKFETRTLNGRNSKEIAKKEHTNLNAHENQGEQSAINHKGTNLLHSATDDQQDQTDPLFDTENLVEKVLEHQTRGDDFGIDQQTIGGRFEQAKVHHGQNVVDEVNDGRDRKVLGDHPFGAERLGIISRISLFEVPIIRISQYKLD